MWKWERRDKKQKAQRQRMPKSGMSVKNIQRLQWERANGLRQR